MNDGVRTSLRWCAIVLLAIAGCTERRLWVRTEPPGAAITVNGTALGPSPAKWSFDHYGLVRITAELPGYQPIERKVDLAPPWWQRPGLDFFPDVLVPVTLHDEHEVVLRLAPLPVRTEEGIETELAGLVERARAVRAQATEPDTEPDTETDTETETETEPEAGTEAGER
jgi:hypothetical protein